MARIVTRNEALSAGNGIKCVIGNIHGDKANQRFIRFCGKNVVDEIDRIQQDAENRAFVYFEKEGRYYHIYKGLNGTQYPGKYTYNVYQYVKKGCGKPNELEEAPKKTLAEYVAIYIKDFRQWLVDHVLKEFKKCDYDKVVEYAGLALLPPDLKVYPHERQLSRKACEEFARRLLAVKDEFKNMSSFEEIMEKVQEIGGSIHGIGRGLAAYDAALRIGAKLDKLPKDCVYAFNGAKIREGNDRKVRQRFARSEFKSELDELTAYEIEDFLCVFHKERENGVFTVLKNKDSK